MPHTGPYPQPNECSAIRNISSCYFNSRSNIITPPKPRIPKSSAAYRVLYQNFVWTHPGLFCTRTLYGLTLDYFVPELCMDSHWTILYQNFVWTHPGLFCTRTLYGLTLDYFVLELCMDSPWTILYQNFVWTHPGIFCTRTLYGLTLDYFVPELCMDSPWTILKKEVRTSENRW